MAYSINAKDYFNTKLWTGNSSSTQAVTNVGFEPSLVWIKQRNLAYSHVLFDAVRGVGKNIQSNSTSAEETNNSSGYLSAFDSDGFTLSQGSSNGDRVNGAYNYVGWSWKANGAGSSNTEGDITATVSANTTSGFSIIKFTSAGSVSQTYGHGLNGTPKLWIIKDTSQSSNNWQVYYNGTDRLKLDTTEATSTNYLMSANATTITTPSNADSAWGNGSGINYITYAFQEIKGFSKINTYTGNNNVDGNFLYTGFKPAFIIIKRTNFTKPWMMFDIERMSGSNPYNDYLQANDTAVEADNSFIDILSNGFKIRTTDANVNTSGGVYLYMAFAKAPLVGSNNVPCTAR